VGLGSIGAEVAKRAAAFGVKVLATTRSPRAELPPHIAWAGVGVGADLDRLLAESDYVLLACPLTPDTDGLMDAARLAKVRRGQQRRSFSCALVYLIGDSL
jgi:phosphoglycerate dehydrogenase-like enzyme